MVAGDGLRLGEIAAANGLVDRDRVEECLAIQAEAGRAGFPMPLGKVFIERFLIDRPTLTALLRAQGRGRGLAEDAVDVRVDVVKFTPDEQATLIERIRDGRHLSPSVAEACLRIQGALERLGIDKHPSEILIERGDIDRGLAADILERHAGRRRRLEPSGAGSPESEAELDGFDRLLSEDAFEASRRLRFGRLAIEKGVLAPEALQKALEVQFLMRELGIGHRVGEVAVLLGAIDRPAVQRIVALQGKGLSRVRWADLARTETLDPRDMRFAGALVANGILDPGEVDVCRFVQRSVRDMGLAWDLPRVVWQKDLLDRELVEQMADWLDRLPAEGPTAPLTSTILDLADLGRLTRIDLGEGDGAPDSTGSVGPLGQLAVERGGLDPGRLEDALAIQADARAMGFPMRMGEILLELFHLERIQLTALLRFQGRRRGRADAEIDLSVDSIGLSTEDHDVLVERARRRGHVVAEQVHECFQIQVALEAHGIDKQLGEILIRKGYLPRELVIDLLSVAVARPPVPPPVRKSPDDSGLLHAILAADEEGVLARARQLRFGRIGLEKGLLTPFDLEEALIAQLRLKELGIILKIGDVLLERGVLQAADVRRILYHQKQAAGRICWAELARTESFGDGDRQLGHVLVAGGSLSALEVDECRFVQRALRHAGLSWDLGRVVWEKGLLGRATVEAVEAEVRQRQAALAGGPSAGPGAHVLRSEALEAAYRELLERVEAEPPEAGPDPGPRRAPRLVAPAGKTQKTLAAGRVGRHGGRSEPLRARSLPAGRRVAMLGGGALLSLVAVGIGAAVALGRRGEPDGPAAADPSPPDEVGVEGDRPDPGAVDRELRHIEAVTAILRSLQESASGLAYDDVAALEERVEAARRIEGMDRAGLDGDLSMALGRAYVYLLEGAAGAAVGPDRRAAWRARAVEHLEAAAAAYRLPGARTIVSSRFVVPGRAMPVDRSFYLPRAAPERRLYPTDDRRRPPGYDVARERIDYGGQAGVAAGEVERLRDLLAE